MKNRYYECFNLPRGPHPDLTDCVLDNSSEPELMVTILKALPEINVLTLMKLFEKENLRIESAVLLYEMVIKTHDALIDLIWSTTENVSVEY